jgi:hypothetical protein
MEYQQTEVYYPNDNLTGNTPLPSDINQPEYIINAGAIDGFNNIIPCPINSISVKYENTLHIQEILLNIINKQEESVVIDNENFKDKDVDELIEQIEGKIPKIMELQEDLNKLHKEYTNAYEKSNKDVRSIGKSVEFMKNIEEDYETNEEVKEIVDGLNKFADSLLKNEKLTNAKEKYIEKRKELNSYIYFIQKLNKWNTSNVCALCFSEKVDVFCNPCGHTGCKKCFDKNSQRNQDGFINNKCPFCREYIMNLKPLYYL